MNQNWSLATDVYYIWPTAISITEKLITLCKLNFWHLHGESTENDSDDDSHLACLSVTFASSGLLSMSI